MSKFDQKKSKRKCPKWPIVNCHALCYIGGLSVKLKPPKNYARIAKPLNDILEGEASKMKSEAVTLPLEALEAFEWLKKCCMTAPVLAFADFEKEFQLETDASSEGLGAMLSQKQPDGKWHPITFRSHQLKGGEAKYHSSKLEFLALKWAITEHFREYLRYRPLTMLMDNNPLTYILTTPNLDALGHRWVATLASYNMTIRYLKGSDNMVADALSWIKTRLDPETAQREVLPGPRLRISRQSRKKKEQIRRSSSVLPNWHVNIRDFVISAQKTGGKLNKWTQ